MTGELVLNEIKSESKEMTLPGDLLTESPVELSRKLQHKLLRVKGEFLNGDQVDYEGMRQSPGFLHFEQETAQLATVDLSGLNDNAKKAFFLNIYNTLTIHALARQVTEQKNVTELDKFWQKAEYRIGGTLYSLDDIEHGIIRCNKLHPTTKEHFFKDGDPRREFVLPTLDPRIHFALNCGAKSCPVIRLFTEDNVDKGLDMATRNFCQNEISIDVQAKRVTLTKILMWYSGDFGPDEKSILEWVMEYLSDGQKEALKLIIEDNPDIHYSDYNWSIV